MKQIFFSVLAFFAAASLSAATPAPPVHDFESSFLAQRTRGTPSEVERSELASALRTKRVVFVTGVLNELAPHYYKDSLRVLNDFYGIDNSIVIFPDSFTSMKDNADRLYSRFLELHCESGLPLVVVAHSKGSAETLLSILRHPDLLETGIIEKIFSLQGAFNGSPVADLIGGSEKLAPWAAFMEKSIPGIRNLTTSSAHEVMGSAMAATPDSQRELLKRRLFFIRSTESPLHAAVFLGASGFYLDEKYGPNDGVLLVQDQMMSDLGTDLGIVHHIDHADFVVPVPYSTKSRKTRTAFTHALVRYIVADSAF